MNKTTAQTLQQGIDEKTNEISRLMAEISQRQKEFAELENEIERLTEKVQKARYNRQALVTAKNILEAE